MTPNNLLDRLSTEELQALLDEAKLGRLEQRIQARTKEAATKSCAVCGESFPKDHGFTLEFGSPDFRRRAHFCAMDCLNYFVERQKRQGGAYY